MSKRTYYLACGLLLVVLLVLSLCARSHRVVTLWDYSNAAACAGVRRGSDPEGKGIMRIAAYLGFAFSSIPGAGVDRTWGWQVFGLAPDDKPSDVRWFLERCSVSPEKPFVVFADDLWRYRDGRPADDDPKLPFATLAPHEVVALSRIARHPAVAGYPTIRRWPCDPNDAHLWAVTVPRSVYLIVAQDVAAPPAENPDPFAVPDYMALERASRAGTVLAWVQLDTPERAEPKLRGYWRDAVTRMPWDFVEALTNRGHRAEIMAEAIAQMSGVVRFGIEDGDQPALPGGWRVVREGSSTFAIRGRETLVIPAQDWRLIPVADSGAERFGPDVLLAGVFGPFAILVDGGEGLVYQVDLGM